MSEEQDMTKEDASIMRSTQVSIPWKSHSTRTRSRKVGSDAVGRLTRHFRIHPEQILPLPASPHVRRVLVITTQMRAAPAAPAAPAVVGPLSLALNRYVHVNVCSSFEF